jgi:hypothetical protein
MGYTGFHAAIPTPIDEEISLAESLTIGCMMRFGSERDSRMLRTDPAKVFSMMWFARVTTLPQDGEPSHCFVYHGGRQSFGYRRPTNDEIMTPSHARWEEFRERLTAELMRPDFDFWYAPQRFPTPAGVTSDFWPLCSAQLLGDMGFAIAESLALFAIFHCRSDRLICEDMARIWFRTKTHSRRPAFDGEPAKEANTRNDSGA